MKSKKVFMIIVMLSCLSMLVFGGTTLISAGQKSPKVIYENGLLTVEAVNIEPEKLFFELGQKCNLDIIIHGDVFPQKQLTIRFEKLPVKEGIKRLVKASALRNYLMDFQGNKPEETRLVKLELFVMGKGQRVLTRAKTAPSKPAVKKAVKQKEEGKKDLASWADDLRTSGKLQNRRSFAKGTDFKWDGSALIDFPEFKGELPFDKSEHAWQDDAKTFSEKTMDTVPPAVRDIVSDALIKACDEVAQDRGVDTITPEITAEALQKIGEAFNLPPNVMKNIPKTPEDLEKPRIPLEPQNLKEDYR